MADVNEMPKWLQLAFIAAVALAACWVISKAQCDEEIDTDGDEYEP